MKHDQMAVLILGIVALAATGCVRETLDQASKAAAPTAKPLTEVIEFPGQTLIFKPTRDDFTVGKVIFSLYCSEPEAVRVNGVTPNPAWVFVHLAETGIVVDTRTSVAGSNAWMYVQLPQVATNRFELAPLRIEVSTEHQGFLCMSVKAWFNEVGNDRDSHYYENPDDRYALVSYCTSTIPSSDLPRAVRSRFRQNRVATVGEFKEIVSRPFVIRLNQLPLEEKPSR